MGAVPGIKGVAFRVWAPHAEKVFATGTFNSWSKNATPMTRQDGGLWFAEVSEAKAGDEYRYLIHGPSGPVSRLDPCARKLTTSVGNAIVYDPTAFDWGNDDFHMATGNELVIYEMHIGTFNAKEKGRPGTFDSAIEKFPYLQNLGINAVEVMPVAEFSGDFSWGYNPSHPFAVEGVYGGPDAFKRFVKSAHEHGIAVIVDVVYNHDSDAFKRIIYTESHDEVANGRARVPEEIWPGKVDSWFSKKRSTLGGALVLASPGIPMIFEGQELLEDRWFHDKDPIDWSRAEDEYGILGMYRDLIGLRRNLSGVTRGLCGQNLHLYHFHDGAKIIAFHRSDKRGPKDSVVVVVNMMNQSRDDYVIGFPRAGIWKTRFNSDATSYGRDFSNHPGPDVATCEEQRDGLPWSGKISIGPYSVIIFSQDE